MHFLVIGYDGDDEGALERRLAVREDHLALSAQAHQNKEKLLGGAMLNDDGQMCGSAGIFEFDSREELDAFLEKEPYINGKVWQRVEIFPFNIAPAFKDVLK
jgi:hypothetical protein